MKVVISAGGTGGHIYPALAIVNKIKEHDPNSEFLYIGTHNRMEKDIVPSYGIPFETIEIYGLDRKNLFNNFRTISCLFKSYKRCKKLIKDFNPDIVIGVGGYVTSPVIYAAHKLGIKTMIHEQNSVPGVSNKSLSKYVDKICVSFRSTIKDFPEHKTVFTGNPCSEDALKTKAVLKSKLGLSASKKLVLFVMGSLGSSSVNKVIVESLPKFKNKSYEVLFVTGKNAYEDISKNKFPDNVKIVPYIDGLTGVMKRTDLIVSRAGASTLSEIIALRTPSILIPSPYVPNNHQYKNALDLVNNKAALLLEERNLDSKTLIKKIDSLMNSAIKLNEMKENIKSLGIDNSAEIIYSEIKKLI